MAASRGHVLVSIKIEYCLDEPNFGIACYQEFEVSLSS